MFYTVLFGFLILSSPLMLARLAGTWKIFYHEHIRYEYNGNKCMVTMPGGMTTHQHDPDAEYINWMVKTHVTAKSRRLRRIYVPPAEPAVAKAITKRVIDDLDIATIRYRG